jgi:hypothetical protein
LAARSSRGSGGRPAPTSATGRPALADAVHRHAHRRERRRVERLHLVEEEHRAGAAALRHLADLHEQHREVALGIAAVRGAAGRLDVELRGEAARHSHRERLQDAQRGGRACAHPLASAHREQHLVGQLRERLAKVARADLLDVVAHPARLARQRLELQQQDRLAHAAKPRVDQAALGLAARQALQQHPESLEVAVAARELERLDARPGRVRIEALIHLYLQTQTKADIGRGEAEPASWPEVDARSLGVDPTQLRLMAARQTLEHLGRGLYRMPMVPVTSLDAYMEAVLWTGRRGVLSHVTALDLYELCNVNPSAIHLTVPGGFRTRKAVPEIYRLHRIDLDPAEAGWHEGIPIVTAERAILGGIQQALGWQLIDQAIATARGRGLITRSASDRVSAMRRQPQAAHSG